MSRLAKHLQQRPMRDQDSMPRVVDVLHEGVPDDSKDVYAMAARIVDVIRKQADIRPVACLPRNVSISDAGTILDGLKDCEWLVLRGNPDGTIGIWTTS